MCFFRWKLLRTSTLILSKGCQVGNFNPKLQIFGLFEVVFLEKMLFGMYVRSASQNGKKVGKN